MSAVILDGTFYIRNEFRMFRNGLAMAPDATVFVQCCIVYCVYSAKRANHKFVIGKYKQILISKFHNLSIGSPCKVKQRLQN